MAESNSNTDSIIPLPVVNEVFEKAAVHLQSLVGKLDSSTLLKVYGLYKQATVGSCDVPQPHWYQMQAKQKWEAWRELKDMSSTTAMEIYVDLINELDPDWDRNTSGKSVGWVAVSSMTNLDVQLDDSDKTIFDWVKEGDVLKVVELSNEFASYQKMNEYDSDGMGLIHWAADRGNVSMINCLIDDLKCDVNLKDKDGQTALHYAAACGHSDVVSLLLNRKANPNISDGDGFTPSQVANESNIVELFTSRV